MTETEPTISAESFGVVPEEPSADGYALARAVGRDTSSVAAYARERYEAEGAIIMAQRFPRSAPRCRVEILASCARPKFAELGVFAFPMGGETIEGPSVALAREMARVWGHIASGFRVLSTDIERCEIHLQGFAIDYQTGARRFEESRVRAKVWRKKEGRWIDLLDENERTLAGDRERQLALLIGRVASKLERNCIIRLMPADLVDESVEKCKATTDQLTTPETAAKAVEAMARLGITRGQIEARIGTAVERASKAQMAELVRIGKSIVARESTIEEWFDEDPTERRAKRQESSSATAKITKTEGLVAGAEPNA